MVGQDGLVANVAKYLSGQPVIGIDPEPDRNAGVLVTHAPTDAAELLRSTTSIEERAMVRASLDDGQRLLALNEIFVGPATPPNSPIPVGCTQRPPGASGILWPHRGHRYRSDRMVPLDRPRATQPARDARSRRASAPLVRPGGLALTRQRSDRDRGRTDRPSP